MFAETNGLVSHFDISGPPDRPPIVFVNSLGTNLHSWDGVADVLGGDFRIIRYDKRGHGMSDAPAGPYSLADFALDLKSLLDHLGVESSAIVGISIGGQIAMEFALRFPEATSCLVLADTGARVGTREYWHDRMERVGREGIERSAESIIPVWFTKDFAAKDPVNYRGYVNMLKRTSTEGYVASCSALAAADLTEQVGKIDSPTMVLVGDQDLATPPELGKALAALLPNALFREIEAAGHLICVEQPKVVAEAIRSFLQEAGYA